MNFTINDSYIEQSFDNIAKQLLSGHILVVNEWELEITEIEFYYFKKKKHEDNYTHPHKRNAGEWRYHNQGIDITLQGEDDQDGGILVRGIKINDKYINGPLKTVRVIMECMGSVQNPATIQLISKTHGRKMIIKTFRHLPNKIKYVEFHDKKYRYLIDLDDLEIFESIKAQIRNNHITI